VVLVPVAAHKGGVLEKCEEVAASLKAAGLRVKLDDRDNVSPGFKFNEWELKGVPVRVEIGPRDIEKGAAMIVRRDTFEKTSLPLEGLGEALVKMMDDITANMFKIADDFRQAHTKVVTNMDELGEQVNGGYAKAMWCGDRACEDQIKERFSATSRNMPFDQTPVGETCVCCGKKAAKVMYFAKAY
jgi:prolyl-tRNA synthetase